VLDGRPGTGKAAWGAALADEVPIPLAFAGPFFDI
jgi:hypothetical protein